MEGCIALIPNLSCAGLITTLQLLLFAFISASSSPELVLFLILSFSLLRLAGLLCAVDNAGWLVPKELPDPLPELDGWAGLTEPLAETVGMGFSVTSTLTPGELELVRVAKSGLELLFSGIN